MGAPFVAADERFWSKVNLLAVNGCWEWTAGTNEHGYGLIHARGTRRMVKAHRVSADHFNISGTGPNVLHSCDNPPCVNPAHLRRGTQAQNMAEAGARGRLNGTGPRAETHGMAKTNWAQVRVIRQAAALGESQTSIARRLGVSTTVVWRIVSGKSWKEPTCSS